MCQKRVMRQYRGWIILGKLCMRVFAFYWNCIYKPQLESWFLYSSVALVGRTLLKSLFSTRETRYECFSFVLDVNLNSKLFRASGLISLLTKDQATAAGGLFSKNKLICFSGMFMKTLLRHREQGMRCWCSYNNQNYVAFTFYKIKKFLSDFSFSLSLSLIFLIQGGSSRAKK